MTGLLSLFYYLYIAISLDGRIPVRAAAASSSAIGDHDAAAQQIGNAAASLTLDDASSSWAGSAYSQISENGSSALLPSDKAERRAARLRTFRAWVARLNATLAGHRPARASAGVGRALQQWADATARFSALLPCPPTTLFHGCLRGPLSSTSCVKGFLIWSLNLSSSGTFAPIFSYSAMALRTCCCISALMSSRKYSVGRPMVMPSMLSLSVLV